MGTSSQENKDNKARNRKKIISTIANRILEYKKHLESVPVDLIPVKQSEKDRLNINQLYSELRSPTTQLLDSKFYSQLVSMNRERDKNFLAEGTTRKERIRLLARMIIRVTTPQLVLNQKRVLELSDQSLFGIKSFDQPKIKISKDLNLKDPIFESEAQSITQEDINKIKSEIVLKFDQTRWDSMESISKELNHWEADIFSQMVREKEIILQMNSNKEDKDQIKIGSFVTKAETNFTEVQSVILEPSKKH